MASERYIFHISVRFNSFSDEQIRIVEEYISEKIKTGLEDFHGEPINTKRAEYGISFENGSINLYIAQNKFEDDWDSKFLNSIVCEEIIVPFIEKIAIDIPSKSPDVRLKMGVSAYEYANNLTITSSVNSDRLIGILYRGFEMNDTYEEDASYVRDWVLNSIPLYSNLTISNTDMEEEITDVVTYTTQTLRDYLKEDNNNRILYTPVVRDGNIVKRSWSILQTDFLEDIDLYKGAKRYGCYILDTMNSDNVDEENGLVDLQAFGAYNMWVPDKDIEEILLGFDEHPAFALIPSYIKYASLVNADVYENPGTSIVSRYHCQDTGRNIIKVHKIVPTHMNSSLNRLSCVTSDKIFRMKGGVGGCTR